MTHSVTQEESKGTACLLFLCLLRPVYYVVIFFGLPLRRSILRSPMHAWYNLSSAISSSCRTRSPLMPMRLATSLRNRPSAPASSKAQLCASSCTSAFGKLNPMRWDGYTSRYRWYRQEIKGQGRGTRAQSARVRGFSSFRLVIHRAAGASFSRVNSLFNVSADN